MIWFCILVITVTIYNTKASGNFKKKFHNLFLQIYNVIIHLLVSNSVIPLSEHNYIGRISNGRDINKPVMTGRRREYRKGLTATTTLWGMKATTIFQSTSTWHTSRPYFWLAPTWPFTLRDPLSFALSFANLTTYTILITRRLSFSDVRFKCYYRGRSPNKMWVNPSS